MAETKIALVTGANRGIGLEVARQLAQRGCIVWLGARDSAQGEAAAKSLQAFGGQVISQKLDVTDPASVAEAVQQIKEISGQLDILVNNAGIALEGGVTPSMADLAAIRATFEVNLFGCIQVTQAFLPLLRESAAARIVMVSSDMGSHTHQSNPAFAYYGLNPLGYIASKAALNAATISFAKELYGTKIKVNAANPGFTATDLNGHTGILSVEQGAAPIVRLALLAADGPTGQFFGPDGIEPW